MAEPGFWDNPQEAEKIVENHNDIKKQLIRWQELLTSIDDIKVLLEISEEEEDKSLFDEIDQNLTRLEKETDEWELETMFSEPEDKKNAFLTIHPGAGGTESQDWAEMLMRMYLRWLEQHGFESEIIDYQPAEEAGIKSITIEVKGKYAYGYLRSEVGIHRLVRISPFDASNRRHTSFASVFVYPEVEDVPEVVINDDDIRIDTYRASGAGGQHVNKVSSAVRITHLPTDIVVQCQSERSQHYNKKNAMKMLKARLYQHYKEKREKKIKKLESKKKDISWGNQIRSYVFHPYNMVKDHRTNVETSNTSAVMDGDIDEFIYAYLKKQD